MDPPRELRPFLRFTRLPAGAAAVVQRVLDADEDFRQRVLASAWPMEDDLGRAAWLYIVRPEGWADELAALTASAAASDAVIEDALAEERATRRLARADERLRRLEAELAASKEREAAAVEELAGLRRARQASGRRAEEAESARDAALAEVARLRDELAAAVRPAPVVAPVVAPPAPISPPVPPVPEVDVDAVRSSLAAAADAVRSAAAALEDAAGLLPEPAGSVGPVARGGGKTPRRSKAAPAVQAGRRRPVSLPPGIFDDSAEAAEHIVRTNGVIVLVDGYNASISAWPDLPLPEQRARLADALAELAARTGADITIVFDGADDPSIGGQARGPLRAPVRTVFSPADVAADDVILEMVDRMPAHRAVVVASDDRQVQDGARSRGANVLTRAQLLATMRRGAGPA